MARRAGRGSTAIPQRPASAADLGLMLGAPPESGQLVTTASWQEGPKNRWAFQHVSELVPSAVVSRGTGPVLPLASALEDISDLPLEGVECGSTLEAFLQETYTDGFLVLRSGKVLCEQYFNGMDATSRHLLMSISKSMCGVVAGSLSESGIVDLAATVSTYVPELWESAYGDATVAHLLDMTASLDFNEDYSDPTSEVQAQDRAAGWRPRRLEDPENSYLFLRSLRRRGSHGRAFQYCSATTDVLAWVLERAAGRRYPQLLAECLWSHVGAEHDALVTVDEMGFAMANGGVSASLRDLGRFGYLVGNGGSLGTHRACSSEWAAGIRAGGNPELLRETHFGREFPRGSYRAQWWVTGNEAGAFESRGIYGQFLWIDPAADVVVVKLSSLPEALDPTVTRDHHRAFASIAAALR
jgi:CubicO group peptidase (beta-lactamase class C family)